MTIKAIETRYAGYRFRSRLEARWAVAFDAGKIKWQYEPEGFETPYGRYLPDFLISLSLGGNCPETTWVEIKPENYNLTFRDQYRYQALAAGTKIPLVVFIGIEKTTIFFFPDRPAWVSPWPLFNDTILNAARSARFEHGQSG